MDWKEKIKEGMKLLKQGIDLIDNGCFESDGCSSSDCPFYQYCGSGTNIIRSIIIPEEDV